MNLRLLCAMLMLTTVCFATARPEVKKAFKANVEIKQQVISSESDCSATAIGPHALLTATHCEEPTDDLDVSVIKDNVKIVGRIRDGMDHTIYLIDGEALKDWVSVEPNKLDITDPVFIWGNPGDLTDMYRTGVFSNIHREISLFGAGPTILYFDLNTFHGDSGAGIFREDGVLVAVTSFVEVQGKDNDLFRMTGAYPLNFKPEDLEKAKTYGDKPATPAPNTTGPAGQPTH